MAHPLFASVFTAGAFNLARSMGAERLAEFCDHWCFDRNGFGPRPATRFFTFGTFFAKSGCDFYSCVAKPFSFEDRWLNLRRQWIIAYWMSARCTPEFFMKLRTPHSTAKTVKIKLPFDKKNFDRKPIRLIRSSNRRDPPPSKIVTLFCNPVCHPEPKWGITGEDSGGGTNAISSNVCNGRGQGTTAEDSGGFCRVVSGG